MIACYDLACNPPTFDVISFLSHVELERKRRGESQVEIKILPGPQNGFRRDGLWPVSTTMRIHLRENVLVPICRLLPSATSVEVLERRAFEGEYGTGKRLISLPEYVKALVHGSRPLRAPSGLFPNLPGPYVTITLREADHHPLRNSQISEWTHAALRLKARGFFVYVIRDTNRKDAPVLHSDIPEMLYASERIDIRAALYENAFVNLGVNNGPMWMAVAMDAPVLMLRPVTDRAGGCYDTKFFERSGVKFGGQLPTSPIHQQLVWEDDTSDNITVAFDRYVSDLKKKI